MKKILIVLFGCLSLASCECETEKTPEQIKHEQRWRGFKVIVIDSCEYLIKTVEVSPGTRHATSAGYMAHKGNCRFCAERQINNKN